MAFLNISYSFAAAAGPLVAGYVMETSHPQWVWYGGGVLCVIAAFGFLKTRENPQDVKRELQPKVLKFFYLITVLSPFTVKALLSEGLSVPDTYFLDGFAFELTEIKVMVETLPIQQFLMGALLNNFSVVDHHHPIRITNGTETVSDHKTGTPAHQT
jgi:MFS family permease